MTNATIIDLRASPCRVGERISWRGRRYRIVKVTILSPDYTQVLLQDLDRRGALPLSVVATDLLDAVHL